MDLTESIVPRSDQINADELIAGPVTYTVREVVAGAAEQPFDFRLVETDRAYRPSKTMRRVIVNAWGADAAAYAGRRLTLYREPSIQFGGQTVGGIRISHMSHISKRVEVMAQTTRGKRETFTVDPLPEVKVAGTDLHRRIAKAVAAFAGIGVTDGQLETRIGKPLTEWTADDVARLLVTFTSIQRGDVTAADEFPPAVDDAPADADLLFKDSQ